MSKNSTAKNIFNVFSSQVGITIVGLVTTLVFPKIMEMEEYALYQTYYLYLSYITILHLGFPDGMHVKYAGKSFDTIDRGKYKGEIRLLLIILALFSAVLLGAGFAIGNKMLLMVAISVIPYVFVTSYINVIQALGEFKRSATMQFLVSFLRCLIALLLFVGMGYISGSTYLWVYWGVYAVFFIWVLVENYRYGKGYKTESKLLTDDNRDTIKLGMSICIGNYVNNLFHAVDQQYIKLFFDSSKFAVYSFALSLNMIMTIFITSFTQPLYYKIASEGSEEKALKDMKEYLFMFGIFASCAFYACSVFVKLFLPKYLESLDVIGVYFLVFPAMAVINCLYLNLYKIRKKTKKYLFNITSMLLLAIVANAIVIVLKLDYLYIAAVTVLVYYVWLFVGTIDFKELRITFKEIVFLSIFVAEYILLIWVLPLNDWLGLLCALVCNVALCLIFYRHKIRKLYEVFLKRKVRK